MRSFGEWHEIALLMIENRGGGRELLPGLPLCVGSDQECAGGPRVGGSENAFRQGNETLTVDGPMSQEIATPSEISFGAAVMGWSAFRQTWQVALPSTVA
jgi:hypothetical protein